ncbi:hypothetical protein HMPREF0101_03319 [Bacteroides fragilis]|nr:hypothetical protein HMPREF0101_03319 [Bacteroides fragilis]
MTGVCAPPPVKKQSINPNEAIFRICNFSISIFFYLFSTKVKKNISKSNAPQIKVIRANNRNGKLNTKNLLKHLEHSSRFSL